MRRPKPLLPFDGQPLIAHVVSNLRALFADIVVVAAPAQELPPLPVTLVRDEVAFQGPIGGIAYGLPAAKYDVCFVTGCDAAFLSIPLISHLLARISHHDVVVPWWEARLQPLHAVYRRRVLPVLREQLAKGDLKAASLFDRV